MDWKSEISRRIDALPPEAQKQVLDYISSLQGTSLHGESGQRLATSAGTIDAVSAQEMMDAIEAECERIDADEW